MGLAQRELAVHFQIERDRQPVLQVVHRHVMHGERAVARDHHDAVEHRFVVERDRIGGDDRLGARHLLADRGGDGVLDRAHAVERQGAADRDGQDRRRSSRRRRARAPARRATTPGTFAAMAVILSAAPAGAMSVRVSMVRRPSRQPATQTRTATTSAAAESAHQRPNRTPPRPISTASEAHRSDEKCSASASSAWLCVCFGGARERARAEEIDRDRHRDHAERPGVRDHRMLFVLGQALDRFPDHHAGEQEQQRGFRQRRNAFDLAVAVVVFLVGRLAGNAHRDIGHHRGAEIDQRMAGLRQDRQRAGGNADQALGDRQRGRCRDRGECDLFFFAAA